MGTDTVRGTIRNQAGVISRGQATAAGLSRRQIDHLLRTGDWIRLLPGVYQSALVVPAPETSVRAASLWLGTAAVLTGWGAGWWWELVDEPPSSWHFVVAGRCHLSPQPNIKVSRSFVDPYDQVTRLELPVLSRPLAALRAAAHRERLSPGDGIKIIDRAKQRRVVSADDLELAFRRNKGTWGTRAMRKLLDRTGDRAHSELERMGIGLLQAAGITGFESNLATTLSSGRRVEFDVAFRDKRLAIEFDGWDYHSDPAQHRADLRRANEIMADGWTIRRYTYSDLLNDPDRFIREILEVLAG